MDNTAYKAQLRSSRQSGIFPSRSTALTPRFLEQLIECRAIGIGETVSLGIRRLSLCKACFQRPQKPMIDTRSVSCVIISTYISFGTRNGVFRKRLILRAGNELIIKRATRDHHLTAPEISRDLSYPTLSQTLSVRPLATEHVIRREDFRRRSIANHFGFADPKRRIAIHVIKTADANTDVNKLVQQREQPARPSIPAINTISKGRTRQQSRTP